MKWLQGNSSSQHEVAGFMFRTDKNKNDNKCITLIRLEVLTLVAYPVATAIISHGYVVTQRSNIYLWFSWVFLGVDVTNHKLIFMRARILSSLHGLSILRIQTNVPGHPAVYMSSHTYSGLFYEVPLSRTL